VLAAGTPAGRLNTKHMSAIPLAQHLDVENDATHKLTRIWEELLGVRPIEPNQNYFDLCGDSLLAVQMVAQIEQVFQVKIPIATLFEAPTIAELVQIINREATNSHWSSLVAIQPKGSRPPFFCMHGAGGNVFIYGLQSQGLDGGSEPQTRIEEMAKGYVRDICRIQPRGPYYLGGYCLGGTIAYEVAQQLRAKGEEVAVLALFDTLNWCKLPPLTFRKKMSVAVERVKFHSQNYLRLDRTGRREYLHDKIQILRNRVPVWQGRLRSSLTESAEGDMPQSVVLAKVWAANDRAANEYIPKPYPGIVTDFRSLEQYSIYQGTDLKWEGLAQGGQHVVQLAVYPAGMLVEPFVSVLADALKRCIDSARP
jgi:phthiocerol/phenolphthiocerol synthesis type-I polyketide synthase E